MQYAERAARRGSPVVALSNGRDSLALCVERRRASALEDDFAVSLEKVGEVQEGAYLGFAGLAADGRRLLDRTRLFAENYRLKHAAMPGVRDMAMFVGGELCDEEGGREGGMGRGRDGGLTNVFANLYASSFNNRFAAPQHFCPRPPSLRRVVRIGGHDQEQ